MYNFKAYIDGLNRKLVDIQQKYQQRGELIDEVATTAILGLDMFEKNLKVKEDEANILSWAEGNNGKYDEETDMWYFPFSYQGVETKTETREQEIDGVMTTEEYTVDVPVTYDTYVQIKPSFVKAMAKNPQFGLEQYLLNKDLNEVRDMFNINISEYDELWDRSEHPDSWDPTMATGEPTDVIMNTIYEESMKGAYVDDYGNDTIRTEVNGEPAMVNPTEAALIRQFGSQAEQWIFDNWDGKVVDDPLDTSIQIRAYQFDSKTFFPAAGFALGAIQFLGGAVNKAREARSIKRHAKSALAGIPDAIASAQNLGQRALAAIERTGEIGYESYTNTLEGIRSGIGGQFSQSLNNMEKITAAGKGLVSGKALASVGDSLDLITRQATQDRSSTFIQQMGVNEQIAQQKVGTQEQTYSQVEALESEAEDWKRKYKEAKKKDKWYKNLSDIRAKENIELVGISNSGINIYEFEYKNKLYGEGRYKGVIAQEVPYASSMYNDGLYRVDYNQIDVNFERID